MATLERDRQALPADAWVEFGLDAFERRPLACLEQIYAKLGLPGFERARPRFEAELARAAGYSARRWELSAADRALVQRHCAPVLERFGYRPPEPGSSSAPARRAGSSSAPAR